MDSKTESIESGVEMCPNGCGEMEHARGQVWENRGRTFWNVTIVYCPVCMYEHDAKVEL